MSSNIKQFVDDRNCPRKLFLYLYYKGIFNIWGLGHLLQYLACHSGNDVPHFNRFSIPPSWLINMDGHNCRGHKTQ